MQKARLIVDIATKRTHIRIKSMGSDIDFPLPHPDDHRRVIESAICAPELYDIADLHAILAGEHGMRADALVAHEKII